MQLPPFLIRASFKSRLTFETSSSKKREFKISAFTR